MQRKTAIGVGLGAAVTAVVPVVISMSLAGGGGGTGGMGGEPGLRCLVGFLFALLFLLVIFLVCAWDCDPVDPSKCSNKCLRQYLYGILVVMSLAIACLRFG